MTPDDFTNHELFIDVGDGHQLYVHDWGKADAAVPIVFLHAGPGLGCDDRDKSKFDPTTQRIIFHDQRGSGRSLPWGSLHHNTTPDLVEDIEKIARRLKLPKFVVIGGSWGSCLALAYGVKYPARLAGMVLNGVFTGSRDEIDWLAAGRFSEFFPDVWDRYLAETPAKHRANPSTYHFQRVLGKDEQAAKASAYVYETLEASIIRLGGRFYPKNFASYDPTSMCIEIHYMAHTCFLPEQYILKHAAKLTMPIWLIQGRYDMVCRPRMAYELHQKLPDSRLIWTINGHLAEHEAANIIAIAQQHLSGVL